MTIQRKSLSTVWEKKVTRAAFLFSAVALAVSLLFSLILARTGLTLWVSAPVSMMVAYLVYIGLTRKIRRRRKILAQPFPAEWEAVLQSDVVFFRALSVEDKKRFRRELQLFLGEKRITGIGHTLDTATRVLTAASAIIPIFGFPEWEWDQISEILVYPDRFNQDYEFESGTQRHTLGMVGTGAMTRMMILARPD
ncbi:MAG: zinc-dependent peptidase, partial [Acidobacteriota bacterium]